MQFANTWLEEYQLISAIRNGDKTQYLELVRRYQKTVFGLLYRITDSKSDAEELTCQTFVDACKKLHRFKFNCKFSNWILLMAIDLAFDFIKKNRFADSADNRIITGKDGRQFNEKTDRQLLLRKAIVTLNKKQQTILFLKYFENLNYEEIGEKLCISEKKARSNIFKTRNLLRNKLIGWNYYSQEIKTDDCSGE